MKLVNLKGFYAVDFRNTAGRRMRKSTGVRIPEDITLRAKAEAEALTVAARVVARENELVGTDATPEPKKALTLGDILDRTYREHWSRLACRVVMNHVVNLLTRDLGHRPIERVDYAWLKGWCEDWIKAGTSPSTCNRRMAAVGKAMREAHARKEVAEIPKHFPHYSEKKYVRERYMSDAEEVKALEWLTRMASDDEADKREGWTYVRHLMVFLLDTGFRFSESFKFTLEGTQADLAHGCTKNTIGRRVPLTKRALEAARYLLQSPIHRELALDCIRKREKAAWDWCDHRFARCMLAIGANTERTTRNGRLTIHGMRHTCASRLVQRGIDLYVVQKWMGHSSIKITERYAKLRKDQFLMAVEALGEMPDAERSDDDALLHPLRGDARSEEDGQP